MIRKKRVNKKRKLDKNMKNRNVIYSSKGLLVILVGVLVVVGLVWLADQTGVADDLSMRARRVTSLDRQTRTAAVNRRTRTVAAALIASPSPKTTIKSSAPIIAVSTKATTKGQPADRSAEVKKLSEAEAARMVKNGDFCEPAVAIVVKNLDGLCGKLVPVSYDLVGKPLPLADGEGSPTPKIVCKTTDTDIHKLDAIPGSELRHELLKICFGKCSIGYQCMRGDV